MLHTEPRLTAYHVRERAREWYAALFSKKISGLEEMEIYIKSHTPPNSIFITPGTYWSFSLKAERAEFVSLTYVPVNREIILWKERLEALNGGPLKNGGI